jgi:UDP-N-acetylglucosamine--N-acetylmuramyl-(pentapeptide) pyrophosphoryl-undecaprenol N-acetylglucosamine transferase
MHLALGAASVVIARAGASSLAELAAMRVPSILVPFPAATDNHQYFNALAFEKTGAARLMQQKDARPDLLAPMVVELLANQALRSQMQDALARWHSPQAAREIAESIMQAIRDRRYATGRTGAPNPPGIELRQSSIT